MRAVENRGRLAWTSLHFDFVALSDRLKYLLLMKFLLLTTTYIFWFFPVLNSLCSVFKSCALADNVDWKSITP